MPSTPELPLPDMSGILPPAKAIAAPVSDAVNPLVIDAAIVAAIPVVVFGVTQYVKLLTGPEKSAAVQASMGRPEPQAGRVAGADSRSAPEIFFTGVENLGKEPFGWLFGKPSALYSNLPAAAPAGMAPARGMGAKEMARKGIADRSAVTPGFAGAAAMPTKDVSISAPPPPPVEDYAAQIAAEYRNKNLMADAPSMTPAMDGVVAPTKQTEPVRPPPASAILDSI